MRNSSESTLSPEAMIALRTLVYRMDQHCGPRGEWHGGNRTAANTILMPWVEANHIADDAMQFLYKNNFIIEFDWPKWGEGRDISQNQDERRFDALDRPTILKLQSAIARNDRFSEESSKTAQPSHSSEDSSQTHNDVIRRRVSSSDPLIT